MWLWVFYIASAVLSYLLYRSSRPKAPAPGEIQAPEVPAGTIIPVAFGKNKLEPTIVEFDYGTFRNATWPREAPVDYWARWFGVLCWGIIEYLDILYDEKRLLSGQDTTQVYIKVEQNNQFFALDHSPTVTSAVMTPMYRGGFPGTVGYSYAEVYLPRLFGGAPPDGEGGIESYNGDPDCVDHTVYGASYVFYAGGDKDTRAIIAPPPIDDLKYYGGPPKNGSCVDTPTTSGAGRIAYERFAMVHFDGAIGSSPVLKKQEFVVVGQSMGDAIGTDGVDANPSDVLYQILTNPDWGLGINPSLIGSSFGDAALQLRAIEGFGISGVMREQKAAEEYINEVLRTIDGVLYRHPETGKLELALVRGGYTVSDLPVFDESNIIDLEWNQRELHETTNEVVIAYTDRNRLFNRNVVTLQDHANIHMTGSIRSQTLEFPWIPTETWALKVGARELKANTLPLGRGTLRSTRAGWGYLPGDPIKVTFARYGLSAKVCRILSANYGALDNGEIEFEIIEDVYGLPDVPYTVETIDADDPAATPIETPTITVTENNDGTYGQVVLTITPNSSVTNVEFTTQVGSDTAVGPTGSSESPSYTYVGPSVLIDPTLGSTITWSVSYTQNGLTLTRTGVSRFNTSVGATSGANSSVIVNNGTSFDFVYDQSSGDQIIVRT